LRVCLCVSVCERVCVSVCLTVCLSASVCVCDVMTGKISRLSLPRMSVIVSVCVCVWCPIQQQRQRWAQHHPEQRQSSASQNVNLIQQFEEHVVTKKRLKSIQSKKSNTNRKGKIPYSSEERKKHDANQPQYSQKMPLADASRACH